MRILIISCFFICSGICLSQQEDKIIVEYGVLSEIDIDSLSERFRANPLQMKYLLKLKQDFEEMEYLLKISKDKSEFETIFKLAKSGRQKNYVAILENKNRFYVDSSEFIEQKQSLGEEFLIIGKSKQMKWKLFNEKKIILGFTCLKAVYIDERQNSRKIVAWYAPEIPFQFGPKGFHGLPGLILEIVQNNTLHYYAKSIKWPEDVFIFKPSTGKKVSRSKYEMLVEQTAKDMKDYINN